MFRLFISNAPFIYIVFISICYITFCIEQKNRLCLGNRTSDTTGLMEIHSVAMLSGFLLPILSIFRLIKGKLVIVIPFFVDLTTSYIIHRIGSFIISFLNIYLEDTTCSKDRETLNGVNGYSYAIVYFFLIFIRLLNSNDLYPQATQSIITLQLQFPTYTQNSYQIFYQSLGPFSCRYSCNCQNYIRYKQKCIYHSTTYIILMLYILSGTICIGHILIHGYATVNQIFYGCLVAYLMVFLFDCILYYFRPMVKAIILICFFYFTMFIVHAFVEGVSVHYSFYHMICVVDLISSVILHISVYSPKTM
ncbi:hypothetical protein ENUP19_0346G0011 [Entamoeba nuttalli]|uniref:Uncharacterized protein n=2 Tax=Entamoeba nuttalli TaxID=412467 RepID=K2H623_ENTNP|nr:hypothetical protein ENU1_000340 [Entamoeba nuttalli P19]EKE43043.1 hypothetical protein ENU1_000340 [Entamoeba nuttalli P19]|eukprot:XP_008854617.1 hypothetical protein ENU1_000340 [Entamoeba nuttalli P19]